MALPFILLGLACWFATLLLVEGEIFREWRQFFVNKRKKVELEIALDKETALAGGPKWMAEPSKGQKRRLFIWHKLEYLTNCHMCTGTWVGLAIALFLPANLVLPMWSIAGWLLNGLIIKAIGHLVLILQHIGEAFVKWLKLTPFTDDEYDTIQALRDGSARVVAGGPTNGWTGHQSIDDPGSVEGNVITFADRHHPGE